HRATIVARCSSVLQHWCRNRTTRLHRVGAFARLGTPPHASDAAAMERIGAGLSHSVCRDFLVFNPLADPDHDMSKMSKDTLVGGVRRLPTLAGMLLFYLAFGQLAFAHSGSAAAIGLESGFMHPITGLDHLVAMVAVGLWGAQLGNPAIWTLPITFPLVMALGGLLGVAGVDLPLPEQVIALSGIPLCVLIALRARPPLLLAAII